MRETSSKLVIFDVEDMIKDGYDKELIHEEIIKRDLEKLLPIEGVFAISLLNEQWTIQKKANQIKVMKVI